MLDIDGLPDPAARLWQAATAATGGQNNVTIEAGSDRLYISRMSVLEAIYLDDPPTRDDVKSWVIATAQRLAFDYTELTNDGTDRSPDRMMILVPLDGFDVAIQAWWHDPVNDEGAPPVND